MGEKEIGREGEGKEEEREGGERERWREIVPSFVLLLAPRMSKPDTCLEQQGHVIVGVLLPIPPIIIIIIFFL